MIGGVGFVGEHEIPAIEAILAAIGDDVARLPAAVLRRIGQQVAAPTAVDAHDRGLRRQHARSLPRMRVVAGELRGRRLVAPDGLDTRPTTDRVREAVFNSLASMGLVVDATYVDLFAGTGALGIEALSRGAEHCTFVERDARALRALKENLAALGLTDRATVLPNDALAVSRRLPAVDVVVADPPYGFSEWNALLADVPADVVVVEAGGRIEAVPEGWELAREKRYGRTFVAQFRRQVP